MSFKDANRFPFSKRTDWPVEENPLSLAFQSLQQKGMDIIDLTTSNPTQCDFPIQTEAILKPFNDQRNLCYQPDPKGIREAREAVAHYYSRRGFDVFPDRMILTSSTSEGYLYLFRLLANPDDQILFPQPSYPLFPFLGDIADVRMDFYPLVFPALKEKLDDRTRAIVLVNPNNPTGSYIKQEELAAMNRLCQQRNLALISDEVFWDFPFSPTKKKETLVQNSSVLSFTLGGLSKTLGLPQMKMSWIVLNGPKKTVEEAHKRLELIADTFLSVNTPAQHAVSSWLSQAEIIQKIIHDRLIINLNMLRRKVEGCSQVQLFAPEGGWYAVVKLPAKQEEEQWVLDFLKEDHVFVHPGYFFDFQEQPFIVLSLLVPPQSLEEGLERIIARIETAES